GRGVGPRGAAAGPPAPPPASRILVLASSAPTHTPMIEKAPPLFDTLAAENGFAVDFTKDPSVLDDARLAPYAVVVQLHMAPFDLSPVQQDALQRYVVRGGGWVGVHAAGLTGRQFVKDGAVYCEGFQRFIH